MQILGNQPTVLYVKNSDMLFQNFYIKYLCGYDYVFGYALHFKY